jgi:putative SOS response-associated peptidase YedK
MCGRFAITTTRLNRIEGTLGITFPEVGPRYNTPRRRASRSSKSPPMRPTSWSKCAGGSSRTGRRSQDPLQHLQHPRRALAEEPAFRGPFRSRRCLIPASGFSGLKTETGRKQPYYLTAADDGGLAFAGLWGRMVRARGAPPVLYHRGRPANALVAEIHNRVVILPEEAYATWLNPRTSLDTVRSLMEPYPGLPVLSPDPGLLDLLDFAVHLLQAIP